MGSLRVQWKSLSIPDHIPLSRRFGVKQGQKTRCVDDFSASGVNSASQVSESPKPHTLDVVGGMLASVMTRQSEPTPWMIRGFDLKNAYRQCAISPSSSEFSYIVVGDPSCEKLYAFKMRALPFGSVRSVHSFLRVANSLWSILSSLFLVINSNYFDDFVALASRPEADSVDHTVKTVLKLLGWVFAQDGPKAPPFAADARVLGVQINVEHMDKGEIKIDNTAARRAELAEVIRHVLNEAHLPRMEALRLRGRMQFASGQLFGRIAKRTLAIVTQHAYSAESAKLSPEAMASMQRFLAMIESDKPRLISKSSSRTWLVFTDASHEPDSDRPLGGIGAVLVDECGVKRRFFSEEVPQSLMEQINVTRRKTLIFECEFLAIFMALYSWRDTLRGCKVLMYTDNDAVRDCVISCNTTSVNAVPILDACLEIESRLSLNLWIARVPTEANVADDPSRFSNDQLLQQGCQRDPTDLSDVLESLGRLQRGEALTSDAIPYGKTCALQLQNARVVRFNFKEAIRLRKAI